MARSILRRKGDRDPASLIKRQICILIGQFDQSAASAETPGPYCKRVQLVRQLRMIRRKASLFSGRVVGESILGIGPQRAEEAVDVGKWADDLQRITPIRTSIFINHAWHRSEDYKTLWRWIFRRAWNFRGKPVRFLDNSVPQENPIHSRNQSVIERVLTQRIQKSNVLISFTAMYNQEHAYWIEFEQREAVRLRKPILTVNPQAQQKKSVQAREFATGEPVGWTAKSVVTGIMQRRFRLV